MDDTTVSLIEVDLKRVSSGILEETGGVPLVCCWVVNTHFGELEYRCLLRTLRRRTRLQQDQHDEETCASVHRHTVHAAVRRQTVARA